MDEVEKEGGCCELGKFRFYWLCTLSPGLLVLRSGGFLYNSTTFYAIRPFMLHDIVLHSYTCVLPRMDPAPLILSESSRI